MKKLRLDSLKVDTFTTTTKDADVRGSVAAHEIDTNLHCPYSYGGTCVISGCFPCYTDAPCN